MQPNSGTALELQRPYPHEKVTLIAYGFRVSEMAGYLIRSLKSIDNLWITEGHLRSLALSLERVPFWNLCATIRNLMENAVSVNVKLSESLVDQAKSHAQVQHRSVPKQIEYWSQIGKIAEENPDLPFFMIRDILIADQEAVIGEYVFS